MSKMAPINSAEVVPTKIVRYRELGKLPRVFFLVFVCLVVVVALNYVFGFGIGGIYMMNWCYYFVLIGLLLPFVFLSFPMRKGKFGKIPWYDYLVAVLACVIPAYFSFYALEMEEMAWATYATPLNWSLAFILFILVLESARRTTGTVFLVVTLIFALYPLPIISHNLPELFMGIGFSFPQLIGHHIFGSEGILGIPMKVVGEILIGFLFLAGLLIKTGAGDFFLNLALSVAGHTRGGPAKVAVIGSAFFGSLSGSVFANIVGTGSITIPAMKRTGYPAYYAGAVEACSSTGGVLMPPVMGAVAFVMAALTEISYATIMVAAFIPHPINHRNNSLSSEPSFLPNHCQQEKESAGIKWS